MSETGEKPRPASLPSRLLLGSGKWYWALVRLAVAAAPIVAFRYHVLGTPPPPPDHVHRH